MHTALAVFVLLMQGPGPTAATEEPLPPPPPPEAAPKEETPEEPAEKATKPAEKATKPADKATTPADKAATPADEAPETGPRVIAQSLTGMGTKLRILVYSDDDKAARLAMAAATAELTRVEALLSEWSPESDASTINKNAGKGAVPISADTLRVLARGTEVSRLSKGAFSLTWAALASLWDFGAGAEPKLPDPVRLRARLPLVNDSRLILDAAKRTAKLEAEGMALGLGGIGKGYAIDRALTVLRGKGIVNALVFVGGDIGVIGSKGDKPWVIGIQDPRSVGFFAVIAAQDEAVVTSGDYQHYFELEGKRYHHILDPRTGMPAGGVRSATVVAKDALSADAFATALFVLGPDAGMKLIESQPEIEAMIVDANNETLMTSGLKDRMRVVRKPTD